MFTKVTHLPGENFYTSVPTHWLRDPRASRGLKAVLSYWQSHAIGYRVTIEQTIAEMAEGRDAIYASVKEGIELGYLVRLQDRAARGRFGALEYTLGPAAFEQQYVRNWGRKDDGTEGPIIEREPGEPVDKRPARKKGKAVDNSAALDVSAGGTAYGSAGNGRTGSGETVNGETGNGASVSGESDTKKINLLKDQSLSSCSSEEDQNPSLRSVGESLPREREADAEGEEFSETERQLLNAAVEKAVEVRSGRTGWSQQAIVAAMQAQLGAGHPVTRVAAAIVTVAGDPEAKYPGRIEFVLNAPPSSPERPALGLAQQAPAWAEGPVKHLAVGTEMCRKHQGEPAHNCNRCAAEVKGADVDAASVTSGPPMGREAAIALMRASTRPGTALRRHEGPWMPERVRPERPDSLARLAEAADQLDDMAAAS